MALGSITAGAPPEADHFIVGPKVPTGARITPTAAPGSIFEALDPEVAAEPTIRANNAVTTATSPDGRTLLVLTSGYNYWDLPSGNDPSFVFDEYVFVYDISAGPPVKQQVIRVPNTFLGLEWDPSGERFYVAGGRDDNVHVFARSGNAWQESGPPIPLRHTSGLGLDTPPMAAGLAVSPDGGRLLVANLENDSVSLIDLQRRVVVAERDLRPGKNNAARSGVPGGEFPIWIVIKGDSKAYVSSLRDREIVVLDLADDRLGITKRIEVGGNPNRMLLDRAQERLFVALDNSDSVAVVDTVVDRIEHEVDLNDQFKASKNKTQFTGSHPNSLALSPNEDLLFVTMGGTNSVAVVPLDREDEEDEDEDEERHGSTNAQTLARRRSTSIGLIPTGWYPNSVSVSADGSHMYVVNALAPAGSTNTTDRNQYVLQKRRAGLLTVPMPSPGVLADLTRQALFNNGVKEHELVRKDRTMAFLSRKIKHVIYIIKENRTYDQVLGDLDRGNGDPSLTMFPEPITPNHHALARQFVTLDNTYCSGSVSGDGWVWSTAGRTSDFTEKTIAVNYAGRGASYDYEGMNRNINVAQRTLEERRAVNPNVPSDPDLLPGTADVAALDGPDGDHGKGYIWDAARRGGLSVRNYGFYGDWTLNYLADGQGRPALLRDPRSAGVQVFYPAATGLGPATGDPLQGVSDRYYREYDMRLPDFWRFKEWEHEFDRFVEHGSLPDLMLIELPRDHTGDFSEALDGTDTPDEQVADNDYALGLIVEKVAGSPFADDTLIFVIEDDAQSGADHVDTQRTVAYVVGPYVKQGAVVSTHYANPNMLRTIVDILRIEPMGLQVALADPMTEVFDTSQRDWTYTAIVPEILRQTELPVPSATAANSLSPSDRVRRFSVPRRDAQYWARVMEGQDFKREDNLDTERFNRALWAGLMGEDVPYPTERHGRDLSRGRERLLKAAAAEATGGQRAFSRR
ncbi:MAG: beta-propeller fold lactonase family protein [Luteitalea sp.]|nr:beta-propeller fold lactonase family protein [Luteitalea sp.]